MEELEHENKIQVKSVKRENALIFCAENSE